MRRSAQQPCSLFLVGPSRRRIHHGYCPQRLRRHRTCRADPQQAIVDRFIASLGIKLRSPDQPIRELSGGNQQKVLLARWLAAEPSLLLLDEPTRGIDVGAKFEIYSIMAALADEGKCILMISSEMPELLGMCDRIYVMNEGRFVGEFASADASQERIMRAIVKQGADA